MVIKWKKVVMRCGMGRGKSFYYGGIILVKVWGHLWPATCAMERGRRVSDKSCSHAERIELLRAQSSPRSEGTARVFDFFWVDGRQGWGFLPQAAQDPSRPVPVESQLRVRTGSWLLSWSVPSMSHWRCAIKRSMLLPKMAKSLVAALARDDLFAPPAAHVCVCWRDTSPVWRVMSSTLPFIAGCLSTVRQPPRLP